MFSNPIMIPIIAIVGGLALGAITIWIKHKEAMAQLSGGNSNVGPEIESLKERVEALETIVTDRKEQLKREIDSL
jgi:hypothetical protein